MKEEVEKCINTLNKGGIILYPTDTIWGIGCDATNIEAIKRIYEIKQRPINKSIIVLVSDENMLYNYVHEVPDLAFDLMEVSDKPMTIVYPKGANLPSEILALDGSIAIRMVKEGFVNRLIHKYRKPIVSTSANISNQKTPTRHDQIENQIKKEVDFIVDQRYDEGGNKASSVVKLEVNGEIQVIRN